MTDQLSKIAHLFIKEQHTLSSTKLGELLWWFISRTTIDSFSIFILRFIVFYFVMWSQVSFCSLWLHCSTYSSASSICIFPLGTVIFFFNLYLGEWADHFLTLSGTKVLRVCMADRLGAGDATENSKLVIILILLHLIVCSSLVGWPLLSLEGGKKDNGDFIIRYMIILPV